MTKLWTHSPHWNVTIWVISSTRIQCFTKYKSKWTTSSPGCENNTWRMDCGCTEANVLDGNHNVCEKTTDKDMLLSQALHRLACIQTDIEIISRHICRFDKEKIFKLPSTNPDGSVFADQAWSNISNIEIACDLNNKESLDWESRVKNNIKQNKE